VIPRCDDNVKNNLRFFFGFFNFQVQLFTLRQQIMKPFVNLGCLDRQKMDEGAHFGDLLWDTFGFIIIVHIV
jgi:hypothetical protein